MSGGWTLSEETKLKMSLAHKGKKRIFSDEHCLNLSKAMKGIKRSLKTRKKISECTKGKNNPFFGKHHSDETKAKISKVNKGRIISDEHKDIISKTHKGRVFSEKHKARISKATTGKNHPMYGKHHSAESKAKISRAVAIAYAEGRRSNSRTCYKNGHIWSEKTGKRIHYRSSYELAVYELLEVMPMVVHYEVEPFFIKYRHSYDEVRRYVPDLLVTYKDGSKDLIEIKSFHFLNEFDKKEKAARKYCERNDLGFKIFTENEIFKHNLREPVNFVREPVRLN
jgi:hypothetical protein